MLNPTGNENKIESEILVHICQPDQDYKGWEKKKITEAENAKCWWGSGIRVQLGHYWWYYKFVQQLYRVTCQYLVKLKKLSASRYVL